MSGDIEDFLRRAAQRRQARQTNKPAPPSGPPAKAEYSDARRERTPQAREDDDDELVVAEVIQEPLSRKLAELKRAQASAQAMREAASQQRSDFPAASPQAADDAGMSALRTAAQTPIRPTPGVSVTTQAPGPDIQSVALSDLREAIRTPQGLRSAILLHEILARPEHRW